MTERTLKAKMNSATSAPRSTGQRVRRIGGVARARRRITSAMISSADATESIPVHSSMVANRRGAGITPKGLAQPQPTMVTRSVWSRTAGIRSTRSNRAGVWTAAMAITRPMARRWGRLPKRPDGYASSRYADNKLTSRRVANASPATAPMWAAWNSGMYQLYPIVTSSGPVTLSGRRRQAIAPAMRWATPTTCTCATTPATVPARRETSAAKPATMRPTKAAIRGVTG
jgi:hypothetical protein